MNRSLIWAGALTACALQTWFAGSMIWDRAQLLRNGTEVTLATGFVDPRDLFRGHYTTLRLEVEDLPGNIPIKGKPVRGETVWLELESSDGGFWQPKQLWTTMPETDVGPLLAGTYRYANDRRTSVDFPIDRYFAPKLEAQRLEKLRRDRKLGIIVALSETGVAAIKGITVDGEKVYDEPVF